MQAFKRGASHALSSSAPHYTAPADPRTESCLPNLGLASEDPLPPRTSNFIVGIEEMPVEVSKELEHVL